jgi:ABC-type lipoprotein release transport system permease subunit
MGWSKLGRNLRYEKCLIALTLYLIAILTAVGTINIFIIIIIRRCLQATISLLSAER